MRVFGQLGNNKSLSDRKNLCSDECKQLFGPIQILSLLPQVSDFPSTTIDLIEKPLLYNSSEYGFDMILLKFRDYIQKTWTRDDATIPQLLKILSIKFYSRNHFARTLIIAQSSLFLNYLFNRKKYEHVDNQSSPLLLMFFGALQGAFCAQYSSIIMY